ncbi:hypothetical protein BAUCODRAFT_150014 [Baudoinia panamericana UAMH 10762]|uniref:Uncharacterized protein n=1 Tax=Baudoinia panamericana (strain UAMH 10762) TaxID=717646 RepID=M2N4T0_BAUPA|nr:uncharacterized protein BAUCODRAFT_150014 [Baudoinia panamericana UAMH 10762]EMC93760.1 hypothetical protein BAUCODRAFT_150014 [Baudoinia panamericana UAMH 10762]
MAAPTSPLLDRLPRELRDQIYGLALTEAHSIEIPGRLDAKACIAQQLQANSRGSDGDVLRQKAIMADDDNWNIPFDWLDSLTDEHKDVVPKLIIKYELSKGSKK